MVSGFNKTFEKESGRNLKKREFLGFRKVFPMREKFWKIKK